MSGSVRGTVNDAEANVMDAAEGKRWALRKCPPFLPAYADTAYKLDKMGMVVDMKDYPDRG